MKKHSLFVAAGFLLAASLLALGGCADKEPEQRAAFITFLNEDVLPRKGVSLPELSGENKKAVGEYAKHYELLTDFQRKLSSEAGKNASELLQLAEFENIAAVARAEKSLRKAAGEAAQLRELVLSLETKTGKARDKLAMPEDLAPVYNAVYEKVVTLPAKSSATVFDAVHDVFAAILDLLDFIDSHSREMEIEGRNINLKNIALMDDLNAKMAVVNEKSGILQKAYAEMARTMLD